MSAIAPKPRRSVSKQDALLLQLQRQALTTLPRRRLITVTRALGLSPSRPGATLDHADCVIAAGRIREALARLTREELKAICQAVGADPAARERRVLLTRLGGVLAPNRLAVAPQPAKSAAAPALKPKRRRSSDGGGKNSFATATDDYRHDATRKNNPPAGLLDSERPPPRNTRNYAYDPHADPQLQWAGKTEHPSFEVDTVSLHIHERLSTQAIVRAVRREDEEPGSNLFAKPNLPPSKEVEFYAHDVGWSNRLVLGDSLLVMNSLIERENLSGQIQCIYFDPPYGVKFNSNFQPSISRRDVKDGDDNSLTREPEQVQAYRDTWELGIHSYLTYLRDRLLLARELLAQSGSIFLQISDDNLGHIVELCDEIFGRDNRCGLVSFIKTSGQASSKLSSVTDFLVWYARDITVVKYRELFAEKRIGEQGATQYGFVELAQNEWRSIEDDEVLPNDARVFAHGDLTSQGFSANTTVPFVFNGRSYHPGENAHWKTTPEGLRGLERAGRIISMGNSLRYKRYFDDFAVTPLNNV